MMFLRLPRQRLHVLFLLVLLLPLLSVVTGRTASTGSGKMIKRPLQYYKDVTKLTDKSFEHETQASTGQTTGSWLVWFYATGDTTLIQGDRPDQEFWDSHNIILASVHGRLCKHTVKRFDIQEFPKLIFFTKRKMHRYQGELNWEAITDFVENGHEQLPGEKVPPPRSELAKMIDTLRETMVGHILIASFFFIIILFAIYARLVAREQQIKKKQKAI